MLNVQLTMVFVSFVRLRALRRPPLKAPKDIDRVTIGAASPRFSVGQRVRFLPKISNPNQPYVARYTVLRVMPTSGLEVTYRIKGDGESHERVAEQTQLEAIF